MKFPILNLLVGAMGFADVSLGQSTWFVKADAIGATDGHSWLDAFVDLQDALTAASAGDRVWVATGTYRPGSVRTDTFVVPDGIELIGGFFGTETDSNQRLIGDLPATILSGDVLNNDHLTPNCQFIGECIQYGGNVLCTQGRCEGLRSTADNVFHVLTTSGCSPTTQVDGFIIEGGAANFWASDDVDGGGIYNHNGSPRLVRCNMRKNFAYRQGAGFYNNAGGPVLIDCVLADNEAAYTSSGRGGGFFNASGAVTLNRCVFVRNSVGHASTFLGGGQLGRGGGFHNGSGTATLNDCLFVENRSYRQGGALYHGGGMLQLTGCTFVHNWSDNLGGGALWLAGPAAIASTLLGNNRSETIGGGALIAAPTQWANCVLEENGSLTQGGGAYLMAAGTPATFNDCAFTRNLTDSTGGALHTEGLPAVLEIRRCTFTENEAVSGGAIFNKRAGMLVNQSRFSSNRALTTGGGIEHRTGPARILGNIFDANSAHQGGALATRTNPSIVGNTIVGNAAQHSGGGLLHEEGKAVISGNILWNNVAHEEPQHGQLIVHGEGASIRFCNIQRSSVHPIGSSNVDVDPLFTNPAGTDGNPTTYADNDYHLSEQSPCIDQGDPARPGGDAEPDVDGDPRFDGCRSDIGADEVSTVHAGGDFSGDQSVDLFDVAFAQPCFTLSLTGAGNSATCHCVFDLDKSGVLDAADWSLFMELFDGPP